MHHLLPFHGVAPVACLPAVRIVGLSKLARGIDQFARGLVRDDPRIREEFLSPTGGRTR